LLRFLDPLGESDKMYRNAYLENYKNFMVNVKRFGDNHKKARFKIYLDEPNSHDEHRKSVHDKRITEWNTYMVITNMYK